MSSTNTAASDAAPATTVDDDDDDDDNTVRTGETAPETGLGARATSTTTVTTAPHVVHDQLGAATLLAQVVRWDTHKRLVMEEVSIWSDA